MSIISIGLGTIFLTVKKMSNDMHVFGSFWATWFLTVTICFRKQPGSIYTFHTLPRNPYRMVSFNWLWSTGLNGNYGDYLMVTLSPENFFFIGDWKCSQTGSKFTPWISMPNFGHFDPFFLLFCHKVYFSSVLYNLFEGIFRSLETF